MSVFTQQHSIKSRRFQVVISQQNDWAISCVSRERVVQHAALSAGDFQCALFQLDVFMRNSIKLLGPFRMGEERETRRITSSFTTTKTTTMSQEDDDRHNIIPKCSLRPLFDSHLLPPLRFSLRATKPYEKEIIVKLWLCYILYMLTPVDKHTHADSIIHACIAHL